MRRRYWRKEINTGAVAGWAVTDRMAGGRMYQGPVGNCKTPPGTRNITAEGRDTRAAEERKRIGRRTRARGRRGDLNAGCPGKKGTKRMEPMPRLDL